MHIPDGFLSTQVWATLDAAAIPTVGYIARKSQQTVEDSRLPLMGVMGAFVFAAQIINFPVGVGTSGHLVGGALLAVTLGPAMASLVMTAILVIQALVFQDGGVLALGANVLNMAVVGVWVGYLPYRIWGRTRVAVFAGGFLSVFVSALLALSELRMSGVAMPGAVLGLSIALFAVSAALEGVITTAVVSALERMSSKYVRTPEGSGVRVYAVVSLAAILLATVGILVASTHPDGIEQFAQQVGIFGQAKALFSTPFADYEMPSFASPWLRRACAGLLGVFLVTGCVMTVGRVFTKRTQLRAAANGD